MTPGARNRLLAGGSDRLVDLLLNDLLDRPVHELVDPGWLAAQLAATARQAADDPKVEQFFRERVRAAKAQAAPGAPQIPKALSEPLREVLARPYVPSREIVGRLLNHSTARMLLTNLFQDVLVGFAKKLKPAAAPKMSSGFAGLRGLQRIGEGLSHLVGEEFEAHVELRAREFMDAGVQRLVEEMADHLCDPKHIGEYGAWRAHGLDVLLATDMEQLVAEVDKLDPESLVATGAALVRGVASQDALVAQLEAILQTAMSESGGRSARELLGGIEAHGVELIRSVMRERARALIDTPAFTQWWDDVVEGEPSS